MIWLVAAWCFLVALLSIVIVNYTHHPFAMKYPLIFKMLVLSSFVVLVAGFITILSIVHRPLT